MRLKALQRVATKVADTRIMFLGLGYADGGLYLLTFLSTKLLFWGKVFPGVNHPAAPVADPDSGGMALSLSGSSL